jgi:uncharacterized protein (TIGR02145 family)
MKKVTILILSTLAFSFAFAQTQMHVWTAGVETVFDIAAVDSITFDGNVIEGIGRFSVSDTTLVTFSKGNLQYHPKNDEWRFADHQTDFVGNSNANISPTYDGWIDLFGKGTGNNPTCCSNVHADYAVSVDWGVNTIGNDAPNTWRSLTYSEWSYLLNTRDNASALCGVAQVAGVNGMVFLPDNWVCPAEVTFKSGYHAEWGKANYAAYQTISASQWEKMEQSGAVFLPAAGYRGEKKIIDLQDIGRYWSSTNDAYSDFMAGYITMYSDDAFMMYSMRYYGMSVRLVRDL